MIQFRGHPETLVREQLFVRPSILMNICPILVIPPKLELYLYCQSCNCFYFVVLRSERLLPYHLMGTVWSSIAIGTIAAAVTCVLAVGFPRQLVRYFLHTIYKHHMCIPGFLRNGEEQFSPRTALDTHVL